MTSHAVWRLLAIVSTAALILAIAVAPPATAQDDGPGPLGVFLEEFDGVITAPPADGREDLTPQVDRISGQLRLSAGTTSRQELRLVTTISTRVGTPAELREALSGDTGTVFSSTSTAIAPLPRRTSRLESVLLDPAELSLTDPDVEGVYPVTFTVFEGPEAVGDVRTALVVLPAAGPAPLPSTMVVDVGDTTALPNGDGVVDPTMTALVDPDSPLRTRTRDLADTAADGSAAGLVLNVSGRVLRDLDDIGDGYLTPGGTAVDPGSRTSRRAAQMVSQVREIANRRDVEVLATPYGPADLVALVRGGEPDEAVRMVGIGRQTVNETLRETPTAGILTPPDGLDSATLAAVGLSVDAVMLPEAYVSRAEADLIEPVRRLRTADGGQVQVLMPDAATSQLLRDPRGEGLAAVAQRLRAETALTWMNADGADSVGILIHAAEGIDLPAGTLTAVNDVLSDASWLRPMSLQRLSTTVTPSDRGVRLAYPPRSRAQELDADYVQALGAARDALVPLRALLPADAAVATDFGRALLVAGALPYRDLDNRQEGAARVQDIRDTLAGLSDAVAVVEGPPITLTSTTGEIPITLINQADTSLSVVVRVGSTGFEFERDEQELLLDPESVQTVTFRATALNPGATSGVGVAVEDPSGQVTLVSSTLAVRSTAIPVVALIATIGGFAFLLLWAVRGNRRRRVSSPVVTAEDPAVSA